MPETRIALDPDQADDLRELITLTAILQEWLEGADGHVLDDLAHFAYRDTFRPRSYAAWLTDDLAGICGRLRKAPSGPQPARTGDNQDQLPTSPGPSPARQDPRKISFGDDLDTSGSIGNQIPIAPRFPRSEPCCDLENALLSACNSSSDQGRVSLAFAGNPGQVRVHGRHLPGAAGRDELACRAGRAPRPGLHWSLAGRLAGRRARGARSAVACRPLAAPRGTRAPRKGPASARREPAA